MSTSGMCRPYMDWRSSAGSGQGVIDVDRLRDVEILGRLRGWTCGSAIPYLMKRNVTSMKKIMAGVVVALVAAGFALTGAPAQAAKPGECNAGGGGLYLCKYEPITRSLPGDGAETFIVGGDSAIWTRWKGGGGTWSPWSSMGGVSRSEVFVESHWQGNQFVSVITHLGTDGNPYSKKRRGLGQGWSGWYRS